MGTQSLVDSYQSRPAKNIEIYGIKCMNYRANIKSQHYLQEETFKVLQKQTIVAT